LEEEGAVAGLFDGDVDADGESGDFTVVVAVRGGNAVFGAGRDGFAGLALVYVFVVALWKAIEFILADVLEIGDGEGSADPT
jgi:hypothetical protein